jgi:hypothetical protein
VPPSAIPHVYEAVGVFHAVLTVVGPNGSSDHATAVVTPVGAQPAQVTLGPPTNITRTSVTFVGQVTQANYWYFQFGTTTDYGHQTQTQTMDPTASARTVQASTTRLLTRATTYHYRLVIVNRTGTFTSPDAVVVTSP